MSSSPEVSICTKRDNDRIIEDVLDFWDGRDMCQLHHPMFINEFGNSAFVIREEEVIAAYLFGFISQTSPIGYVHLIAVRSTARRRRLAHKLFDHFIAFVRSKGCTHIKSITTPSNFGSIAFHKSLGMQLLGEPNNTGVLSLQITQAAMSRVSSSGRRSCSNRSVNRRTAIGLTLPNLGVVACRQLFGV